MTTIFESSSILPISIQNVTILSEVESSLTERTQESGALAACFFLAFTLGAFSALLSKVSVVTIIYYLNENFYRCISPINL